MVPILERNRLWNITVVGKPLGKVALKPSCWDPNGERMERLDSLPTLNSQTERPIRGHRIRRSCWGWCTTCNRHISGNLVEWARAWFPDQSVSTCPQKVVITLLRLGVLHCQVLQMTEEFCKSLISTDLLPWTSNSHNLDLYSSTAPPPGHHTLNKPPPYWLPAVSTSSSLPMREKQLNLKARAQWI